MTIDWPLISAIAVLIIAGLLLARAIVAGSK